VRGVDSSRTVGYGVRALVDGAWGFAGSDRLDARGLDETAARAVAIARASAQIADRIRAVAPTERYVDSWSTPVTKDPRTVGLSAKADHLLKAEKALHVAKSIVVGYAFAFGQDTVKEFYSTTGSAIDQRIVQTGAGVGCHAVGGGDAQTRRGPGDFGLFPRGGWEVGERADPPPNPPPLGDEAGQPAKAP